MNHERSGNKYFPEEHNYAGQKSPDQQMDLDLKGGRMRARWRLRRAISSVVDYAGRISSVGYTAGNAVMTVKAGIHPDMDTAAGLLFGASSLTLGFADRYPVATYRVVGALCGMGTLALSSKGINLDTGQIVDWLRVTSPMVGFGTAAALMGFQKEIADLAQRSRDSKNRLKKAFLATQKYPVALAAAIDSVGVAGVGISAAENGEIGTLSAAGLWGIGVAGLFLSDPRIKSAIRKKVGESKSLANPVLEGENSIGIREEILSDNRQLIFSYPK